MWSFFSNFALQDVKTIVIHDIFKTSLGFSFAKFPVQTLSYNSDSICISADGAYVVGEL